MPLPPEFRVTQADGVLHVEWDNRRVPKGGGELARLVIGFVCGGGIIVGWMLVCAGVGSGEEINWPGVCIAPCFLSMLVLLGYLFLCRYAERRWHESIEVSCDAITHATAGWLAPRPRVYPLAAVEKLVLGWYRMKEWDPDPAWCGVRIYIVKRNAVLSPPCLTEWITADAQEQLFLTIRDFAAANGIPLQTGVWGDAPHLKERP